MIKNRLVTNGRNAVIKNKSYNNNSRDFDSFVLVNNEHIIVLSVRHIHEILDVSNNIKQTKLAPTFERLRVALFSPGHRR